MNNEHASIAQMVDGGDISINRCGTGGGRAYRNISGSNRVSKRRIGRTKSGLWRGSGRIGVDGGACSYEKQHRYRTNRLAWPFFAIAAARKSSKKKKKSRGQAARGKKDGGA